MNENLGTTAQVASPEEKIVRRKPEIPSPKQLATWGEAVLAWVGFMQDNDVATSWQDMALYGAAD